MATPEKGVPVGQDAAVNAQIDSIQKDVKEVKDSMKVLAAAMTKLALVEERQIQTAAAIDRAFMSIEKLETQVNDIRVRLPELSRASDWVDRAIWAAAAAALIYMAKTTGLI